MRRGRRCPVLAYKPAKVLVVGGTGFIGKRLVARAGGAASACGCCRAASSARSSSRPAGRGGQGALDDSRRGGRALGHRGGLPPAKARASAGRTTSRRCRADPGAGRGRAGPASGASSTPARSTPTIRRRAHGDRGSTPLDPRSNSATCTRAPRPPARRCCIEMHRKRGLPLVIFRPGVVIGEGCPPAHGAWACSTPIPGCSTGGRQDQAAAGAGRRRCRGLALGLDAPGIEGRTFLLTDAPLLTRASTSTRSPRRAHAHRATPTPIWRFFVLDLAKEAVKTSSAIRTGGVPATATGIAGSSRALRQQRDPRGAGLAARGHARGDGERRHRCRGPPLLPATESHWSERGRRACRR